MKTRVKWAQDMMFVAETGSGHAVVMDGAVVGRGSIVGAGAVVTQGMQIPAGSLVLGAPAKVVRQVKPEELASVLATCDRYIEYTKGYQF